MASIYKNEKTGKWEFVFGFQDDNGKRKQVRRKGFKTKREAEDRLVELQKEVLDNDYIQVNHLTLGSFMQKWLEDERKMKVSESSYYNSTLYLSKHIMPKMGNVKLRNLNPLLCQKFINDMHKEGYTHSMIDLVTNLVKQALDRAIVYKLIKDNPMRKTTLPKKEKKEMTVWTTEQVNHFLNFTKERRFYSVYATALFTGCRIGEILGLRWQDIDYSKKTITITQSLTFRGKDVKRGTKTHAGERVISISEQLINILKKQRLFYLETKMKLGDQFEDMDLVFFNLKNGKTILPSNLGKVYRKDVRDSGLPRINFHSLRHTHATMLISKNVNVKIISERLGHSNIGVTLNTYSHVLPSMQQEVANQLDEIISV